MKKLLVLCSSILVCGSLVAADSDAKSDVKAAAKKLGNNYSWTTTPKVQGGGGGGGNFRPGPTEGHTADGTVHLKMTFGERNPEAIKQGEKVAIKGEEGWQSADELEGNRAFMARRFKTYKAPAEEAQDLADKAKSLKKDGDAISGDLSDDGAKEFLTFGRRPDSNRPGPKDAKGSVKFWVKDGQLTKYEYHVQGKVTGRDDQEMDVDRTVTTEIKSVGSTKVSVPDEAKKKLS